MHNHVAALLTLNECLWVYLVMLWLQLCSVLGSSHHHPRTYLAYHGPTGHLENQYAATQWLTVRPNHTGPLYKVQPLTNSLL